MMMCIVVFQEDFIVKIQINHKVVHYQSPQIPTVGKTTLGQAGTLAAGPGQIYQNFLKRQTYESLVSWCSFNTWNPTLTDDVPGFVAGAAEQTLFQNLITFSARKRL